MPLKISGCLKWIAILALIAGLITYGVGEYFFNINSNLVAVAVRDSKLPLEVRLKKDGWKKVTDITRAELSLALTERYREEGFRWCSLVVRRQPAGMVQRVAQGLFGAEVNVLFISPDKFDFQTSYRPKFALTTAVERMQAENLWFAINANFRDPDSSPLGWVYHEGRLVNPPFPKWTGCFFVKNGKPYFGSKKLLDSIPGPIEEGTQGYPSVMRDHQVFSYVDLEPNRFYDGTKISYRSLAAMKQDGTIVFVLSGDGGVMNVSEVTEIARKLDVQHATLLDGGRALQYSIRTETGAWHFHAFNTSLDYQHKWLERQRSPVYIGVRKRAPKILVSP
jgi:uncharacterized protein YigE (DUF2233 family)